MVRTLKVFLRGSSGDTDFSPSGTAIIGTFYPRILVQVYMVSWIPDCPVPIHSIADNGILWLGEGSFRILPNLQLFWKFLNIVDNLAVDV